MVSTRHHPRAFPEPTTPTGSTRSKSTTTTPKSTASRAADDSVIVVSSSARKGQLKRSSVARSKSSSASGYVHKVPPLLQVWLYISLPLVSWDMGYVFLRPHSMPGGKFHSPIWSPYALYGTVDYVYGWPAWNNHEGFTASQSALNAIETAMYIYYLTVIRKNGAKGVPSCRDMREFFLGANDKAISGPGVAAAVLVLFSAAVMTLSKTVLYWLIEYFGGFSNVGHNTLFNLVLIWIIPNGLWLVFPVYIIYVLGIEMIHGMNGSSHKKAT